MTTGVLLMAYGSPTSIDDTEAYFKDIRGGTKPSPEAVEVLRNKYIAIGGPSTLNEVTDLQASALQQYLDTSSPGTFEVFTGMKHWHPFIADTVKEITDKGIDEVIGLVLAPHYSSGSIGQYEKKVRDARQPETFRFNMVHSWYSKTRVFFTAHSLPQRLIDQGDPYVDELNASAKLIAEQAGLDDWEVAWQSASHTGEPWIGPDILERLKAFADDGGHRAVVAPIGFVSDHLEILYDVDIECAEASKELGIEFRRIKSPNDNSRFVSALAEVVMGATSGPWD
ncbi:MAG: ferrochelatase [Actinobacteria bacterium]|nr:ferrochelatase [Actinomycetota bacterium]